MASKLCRTMGRLRRYWYYYFFYLRANCWIWKRITLRAARALERIYHRAINQNLLFLCLVMNVKPVLSNQLRSRFRFSILFGRILTVIAVPKAFFIIIIITILALFRLHSQFLPWTLGSTVTGLPRLNK